jgi:hypothetical protein
MASLGTRRARILVLLALITLAITACDRGASELDGWRASDQGTDLWLEARSGPEGEDVLAMLYTMSTGTEYVIEREGPPPMRDGRPAVTLRARSTRTLYLTLALVDSSGQAYECSRILAPGEWRTLDFEQFSGDPGDGLDIVTMRLIDRTALLGSQGPVSLKLVGLPSQ